MVPLFNVDDRLIFITSKDKIDEVYASLKAYFNIEDDEYLNKYFGIAGPPPTWLSPSKAALSNQKNPQYDFRREQVNL